MYFCRIISILECRRKECVRKAHFTPTCLYYFIFLPCTCIVLKLLLFFMKGLTAQQLNNIYSQHNKNELKLTFIPIWIPCSFKMENHLVQLLASTHSLAVVKSKI